MSKLSMSDETEAAELMAALGITQVQAVQYRYKEWRYSNLWDAVAQARRDMPQA